MGASDHKGLARLTNRNRRSCEKFETFVGKVSKILWGPRFKKIRFIVFRSTKMWTETKTVPLT